MWKRYLIQLLFCSRLYRLCTPWFGGYASILLLHRVRPSGRKGDSNDWLEVTPEFLERYLLERQRAGWRFISLDYLLNNLEECRRRRKNMVVTLDDGYRDNYLHAWPLFRRLGVPFTVYVANSFPNGTADLWWYRLAAAIAVRAELTFDLDGKRQVYSCADRDNAFREIRRLLLTLSPEERRRQMDHLPVAAWTEEEGCAMTWDEIREMAEDPLCTIGCHTMTHQNLANLHEEEAWREIVDSRAELEAKTGRPVAHFAYPYGTRREVTVREVDLVRQAGFRSAVTTDTGNIFPEHHNSPYNLPRIPLFQGGTFEAVGMMALAGLHDAVASIRGRGDR